MMKITEILSLMLIFNNFSLGDKLNDCQLNNIHFEKVVGFKPSSSTSAQLLHRDDSHPVTIECIKKCQQNNECGSFVLHYDKYACYWFKINSVDETNLVVDTSVSWFTKTCFYGKVCQGQLWKFERIPGAILIGNDTKTLPGKVTRNECQQNCLISESFQCRSAKFRLEDRSNDVHSSARGTCILSDADRYFSPNSFRTARDDEEYFENECAEHKQDTMTSFCAYEEYEDVILQHVDAAYEEKTKSECENLCNNFKEFHCRGFSLYPAGLKPKCLLHSENSKIYGPRLLQEVKKGYYYERARCLNITVMCTEEHLTVIYRPELDFRGRIYMQGYSENAECYTKGQGFKPLSLKLPLPHSQCGIIEALSLDNRKLLSAPMVIQYNSFIQTQGDRLIKVGCIFGNDSKLVIGTGVTVARDNSNNGSSLVNSTTDSSKDVSPLVQMKLLDHQTQEEISETHIGQELDLIIESTSEGNFDIWAAHLIAMTETGAESILLLDDRGCPTDLNIFPYLEKYRRNNKTILIGTFQSFKFSSSPAVRFSVIVQFCPNKCPEIDCSNQYRQKRAEIETLNGTTILKVDRGEFENINSQFFKKPLEIMVVVRNQKLSPDRLAFGGNKVLVAAYNYDTDEVCIDYSLLLSLIISAVLIQIIIVTASTLMVRKYRRYYQNQYLRQVEDDFNKNFDLGTSNLDARRVRWADDDDLQIRS